MQKQPSPTSHRSPCNQPPLMDLGRRLLCIVGITALTGACVSGESTGAGTGGTTAQPGTGGLANINGSGGAQTDAELTKLVMKVPLHTMFAEDNTDAAHAGGSWQLNGESLDFAFGSSSFTCDGPGAGENGTFKVIELSATVLTVELNSDDSDDRMTFSRVGAGTGVVGTWQMEDGDFIITFQSDGSMVASGSQGECMEGERQEDGRQEDGYYTDEGCFIARLERNSMIVADGRFEDWSTASSIEAQERGSEDEVISKTGADLEKLRVAASATDLFLLLETKDRLNSSFRGSDGEFEGIYEITIRHDANGGGTRMLMFVYDADAEQWRNRSGEEGISIDAGDRGLEVRISWSTLDNPTQVYEISTRSRSCNDGPSAACEIWDEGPCIGEDNP